MAQPSVSTIGNALPLVTGGIWVAPLGTPLPVDGDAPLDPAFVSLGYVSEDGIKPDGDRKTNPIKDWGGDIIANLQEEHASRFQFTLYAVYDPAVLKVVFGDANVTEVAPGKFRVVEDGAELPHLTWAFAMRGIGGKKQRFDLPEGQVTTVKEGSFKPADLQSFELTVEAYKVDGEKVIRHYDAGLTPLLPTVVSHSPAGSVAAAGGELLTLTGTGFTGATAVTIDGTAAPDFEVISATRLALITPAKAAGSYPLLVTTPAGVSAAHTVTYA